MRSDAFLKRQASRLALVNQSSFLLASLTFLHLSGALLPLFQFLVLWLSATLAIVGFQLTMAFQVNQTPDLATILRTLASYTPTQPYTQPQPPFRAAEVQGDKDLEEGEYDPDEYDPSSYDPSLPLNTTSYPQTPIPPPLEAPQQRPPPPILQHQRAPLEAQKQQPPPIPQYLPPPLEAQQRPPLIPQHQPPPLDAQKQQPPPISQLQSTRLPAETGKTYSTPEPTPATLTTWAPALMYLASHLSSDSRVTQQIRHFIKTQHTHERQWWFSRLDLIKKLEGRNEKKRKLDSVLSSIGGKVGPSNSSDLSPEKELEIFDKKVYRACKQMVAATTEELGKLEVPFFCTAKALVVEKGKVKRKGMIYEEDLVKSQLKMLDFLEGWCEEEQQGQEED